MTTHPTTKACRDCRINMEFVTSGADVDSPRGPKYVYWCSNCGALLETYPYSPASDEQLWRRTSCAKY